MVRSGGATGRFDSGETAVFAAIYHVWFCLPFNDRLVNNDLCDITHRRQLIHCVEEHSFENRSQTSCARLTLHCAVCDRTERFLSKLELGTLHFEQPAIL